MSRGHETRKRIVGNIYKVTDENGNKHYEVSDHLSTVRCPTLREAWSLDRENYPTDHWTRAWDALIFERNRLKFRRNLKHYNRLCSHNHNIAA